jgi:hypothetical protein
MEIVGALRRLPEAGLWLYVQRSLHQEPAGRSEPFGIADLARFTIHLQKQAHTRSTKRFNANSLRRVRPRCAADFGLRAEVERT